MSLWLGFSLRRRNDRHQNVRFVPLPPASPDALPSNARPTPTSPDSHPCRRPRLFHVEVTHLHALLRVSYSRASFGARCTLRSFREPNRLPGREPETTPTASVTRAVDIVNQSIVACFL